MFSLLIQKLKSFFYVCPPRTTNTGYSVVIVASMLNHEYPTSELYEMMAMHEAILIDANTVGIFRPTAGCRILHRD
jgi:hypothetical protein